MENIISILAKAGSLRDIGRIAWLAKRGFIWLFIAYLLFKLEQLFTLTVPGGCAHGWPMSRNTYTQTFAFVMSV